MPSTNNLKSHSILNNQYSHQNIVNLNNNI